MVSVPVPVTWPEVTSIVSNVVLSDVFLMVMLPVSTSTASEKVMTRLELVATPVALSAGERVDMVGSVMSAVVKFQVVVSAIPAKELPDASSKAVASIFT